MPKQTTVKRCAWPGGDPLLLRYHDEEWGVPTHSDRQWLEHIVLGGFQAGLSWKTVLYKREAFRKVFHNFEPQRVAGMSAAEIEAACGEAAIIRNRLKIRAAVRNAAGLMALADRYGSFDAFIWSFSDGKPLQNRWRSSDAVAASSPLSDKISRELKKAGFGFVGSTICYAFMQAGGMINDHLVQCFRHAQLAGKRARF